MMNFDELVQVYKHDKETAHWEQQWCLLLMLATAAHKEGRVIDLHGFLKEASVTKKLGFTVDNNEVSIRYLYARLCGIWFTLLQCAPAPPYAQLLLNLPDLVEYNNPIRRKDMIEGEYDYEIDFRKSTHVSDLVYLPLMGRMQSRDDTGSPVEGLCSALEASIYFVLGYGRSPRVTFSRSTFKWMMELAVDKFVVSEHTGFLKELPVYLGSLGFLLSYALNMEGSNE